MAACRRSRAGRSSQEAGCLSGLQGCRLPFGAGRSRPKSLYPLQAQSAGPSCSRRRPRRSIIARFESGEVLLTTIAEVSFQIFSAVLARDTALGQLSAKSDAIQFGQAGRLAKREPPVGVVSAG